MQRLRTSFDRGWMGRVGEAGEGADSITGEEYLAEVVRIAKMVERGEIGTIECSNLLGNAVSKREAYLKKYPESKTRPNPEKGAIVRRGTTEWDVFHKLSMNRLKKNGIHL